MAAVEYVYEALNADNLEPALRACADVFAKDEPLAVHVGSTTSEIVDFTRPIYEMIVKNDCKLSQVVRFGVEGPVAAVMIVYNQEQLNQLDEAYLASVTSDSAAVVSGCLHSLEEIFLKMLPEKLGRDVPLSKVAYCMMRSVTPEHRGKGLAKVMHERMLNTARTEDYVALYSKTTNVRSKSLVQRQGGMEWDCVKYGEYTDEKGNKPFANMDMKLGNAATLMVTILDT
ncbi:hypothetical protein SARC_01693 [Sphaeroforma arctica JP610]|uniref:N-acetyltransferase domain-containing protein n=1 Tax=Sphaeroforma arctica JP610 TaxID=667725 RepID=A0A0L0GAY0_9EUKA|nr:hypothetical protein SARC_01693 [Sphaeroforma arctica JP610]KNC86167.1 hypothetical protein SARC_01693 [Sphaeroforma arctica JP610]|eukprot:XP_014160069.1 hypothetical protein SARC_01693 [Sphaeroforma arctica JP610]